MISDDTVKSILSTFDENGVIVLLTNINSDNCKQITIKTGDDLFKLIRTLIAAQNEIINRKNNEMV